jgi:multidrug efflux pump subunit AcrB
MGIVQLALREPYTFIVAALSVLIVSLLVILRTPTDIFRNINIPIVAVGTTTIGGASNGQAEDSLWTLFRGFKTGSVPPGTHSASPKVLFRHT